MRTTNLQLLMVYLLIVSGCDSGTQGGRPVVEPSPPPSPNIQTLYLTDESLMPPCNSEHLNQLVYIVADKQFFACSFSSGWSAVDIRGPQGPSGAKGDAGAAGSGSSVSKNSDDGKLSIARADQHVILSGVEQNSSYWTLTFPIANPSVKSTLMVDANGEISYEVVTPEPGPTGPIGPQGQAGATGPAGASGATGSTGPQGPQGIPGSTGAAGINGSVIYSGGSDPSVITGVSGDFYLNSTTGDYFLKSAGGWSFSGNLKGSQGIQGPAGSTGATGSAGNAGASGVDGSKWFTGTSLPADSYGANGDYFLNITSGDFYTRAAGSWGSALGNLKQGAVGPGDGPAGSDWSDGSGRGEGG